MPGIVFANKLPPKPTERRVQGPPPPTTVKQETVVKTTPAPPKPGNVIRAGQPIQKTTPVSQPKPIIETTNPEPVVETKAPEPVKVEPKNENITIKEKEIVADTNDDDWGIMQVTKKKSSKEIAKSVQNTIQSSSSHKTGVLLDTDGINLLIETIVGELSKQFVRKDEVVDLVTLALQKMVMEDVKPKE